MNPGNLLIAIQDHAQTVAAGAFFEEGVNASGAPERNHIGLRDHQHGVRKIGEQARGGIEAAGGVDDDEAVVIHQQIEQAGQFSWSRFGRIRLLRSGQKMQALFGRSHQAVEQRDVEAVQVLQSVEHAELRAQVEMKRGVTDGSKVDQNDVAVRLLQRDGSVDSGGGATGASLGAEEREDPGLAGATESASA